MGQSELGDIGDQVVFENDRVRVWDMTLEPGEASPPHHHDHDYIVVVLEGDAITVDQLSTDEHREGDGYGEMTIAPGDFVFLPRGATEIARNTGSTRYRDIQIELR